MLSRSLLRRSTLSYTRFNLQFNYSQAVLKTLKNFNFFHKEKYNDIINELEDVHLTEENWEDIIQDVVSSSNQNIHLKLPYTIAQRLNFNSKNNILESFLAFILSKPEFHNLGILIALFQISIKTPYSDRFLQLILKLPEYDQIKEEREFITILLTSSFRNLGLEISRNSDNYRLHIRAILSSTEAETYEDIRPFIVKLIQCQKYLHPDLTMVVFQKIQHSVCAHLMLKDFLMLFVNNLQQFQWKDAKLLSEIFDKCNFYFPVLCSSLCRNPNVEVTLNTVQSEYSCDVCGAKLAKEEINDETCEQLEEYVMKNVLKVDSEADLFCSTNPSQLRDFLFFLNKFQPFDCVVDLSNYALMQNRRNYDSLVAHIVLLAEKYPRMKKFLLLGKPFNKSSEYVNKVKAMLHRHNKQTKDNLRAHEFFTDYMTKDDLFLLVAALRSRSNCYLMSVDQFRDHRAKITDVNRQSQLSHWQFARQISILGAHQQGVMISLEFPNKPKRIVSYEASKSVFHVPYFAAAEDHLMHFRPQIEFACVTIRD